MSDKQYKMIRKQLKNVVQGELQTLLHEESFKKLYGELVKHTDTRLENVTKMVKEAVDNMDKRSQDIQSYVVRNVGVPQAPTTKEE